jgi:hypothetical protein
VRERVGATEGFASFTNRIHWLNVDLRVAAAVVVCIWLALVAGAVAIVVR